MTHPNPALAPMLATKYSQWQGPCWSQPKLDGVRCIANKAGMWTREGNPITTHPNVLSALVPVFKRFPWLILDGELYSHDLKDDFEAIRSSAQHTGAAVLQYHVFDCFGWEDPRERCEIASKAVDVAASRLVQWVGTEFCQFSQDLDDLAESYLSQGYEGQIIRAADAAYTPGRRGELQKRKPFEDGEFPLIRFEPDASGLPLVAVCKADNGGEFKAQLRANRAVRATLYAVFNKVLTVRHLGFTANGLPRHAVAVGFHGYSRAI